MFTLALNAKSQQQNEVKTDYDNKDVIAYASKEKDTLYVIDYMVPMMNDIWNLPDYINTRPIIIPVISLRKFFINKED